MARIPVPYEEIDRALRDMNIKPTEGGFYSYDHTRVYERINGKFVAYGYRIVARMNNNYRKGQEDYDIVLPDRILF